jgi:hypothetical protein
MSPGAPVSAPLRTTSPRFSFAGYSFLTWCSNNAAYVKTWLAGESAAIAAQQWKLCGLLAVAMVVKFAADAVDYFITQVPLPPPAP